VIDCTVSLTSFCSDIVDYKELLMSH